MIGLFSAPDAFSQATRPRLLVVISIDQFRPDYLQRFRRYFGPGGFNLLLSQGAEFSQAEYEHSITQTCPGHAVILTGSYANAKRDRGEYLVQPRACAGRSTVRSIVRPS